MTPNRDALMACLERVVEPCSLSMGSPMSICDMGLVEDVRVTDGVVDVVLCLTDPGCINFGSIRRFITDELMTLPAVKEVRVRLTTVELWTPDRMRPPKPAQVIRWADTPARSPTLTKAGHDDV